MGKIIKRAIEKDKLLNEYKKWWADCMYHWIYK